MSRIPNDCETPRRPWLVGANYELHAAVIFRPRCKLWSCPYCARINRGLWAVRTFLGSEHLIVAGWRLGFLTLTSHELLDAAGTLAVWPKNWAKLRSRAYREVGQFPYVLIPEQHQDGRLHVHAVEGAGLSERWWKDNGRECGLGYMAEEAPVRSPAGAAFYVSKYISKTLGLHNWPEHFRRVRTSQNWPKIKDEHANAEWQFAVIPYNRSLEDVYAEYESENYVVKIAGSDEAWRWIRGAE